jgi:hypothetical protein
MCMASSTLTSKRCVDAKAYDPAVRQAGEASAQNFSVSPGRPFSVSWVIFRPPLTEENKPLAVFSLPPLTEENKPLAVFTAPPLAQACSLLAVFRNPPLTEDSSPLAVLPAPPLIGDQFPLATLPAPPLTEENLPRMSLAWPTTHPPKLEKLCRVPTTTLCEPVRMLGVVSGGRGSL